MAGNVITLLDRFSLISAGDAGDGPWYSTWARLPVGCTVAEFVVRCDAQKDGVVNLALETSMDRTAVREVISADLSTESFKTLAATGLGVLVRAKTAVVTKPLEFVLSAHLIPKLV